MVGVGVGQLAREPEGRGVQNRGLEDERQVQEHHQERQGGQQVLEEQRHRQEDLLVHNILGLQLEIQMTRHHLLLQ